MKRVYGTDGTGPGGKGRSSVLLGDDCADRVQWVSNEFGARGKSFSVTDGYRPDGVEADYWVDNPSKTSTGGFNQWYAIGQHRRRGAAYAAPVGGSDHAKTGAGQGAIDCSVQDMALRHELMGVVGLEQTDSTETWHFAIRRSPAAWWSRNAVTYPGQAVTPTKPTTPTITPKVQEDNMLMFQQSDGTQTFAWNGGAKHIDPETRDAFMEAADKINKFDGVPNRPIPMTTRQITLMSEATRAANGSYIVRDLINSLAKKFAAKLGVKID